VIRAFILALCDLSDRRILAILFQALAITAIIFLLLGVLLMWLMTGADPCAWVGAESCPLGGVAGGASAVVMTLVGAWLLFPGLAIGVVTCFADRIAAAVELRHYGGPSESHPSNKSISTKLKTCTICNKSKADATLMSGMGRKRTSR
jgi:CysZ protein